jgi:hypothetical protein
MTPEELDAEEAKLPQLMAQAVREAAARAAATAESVLRVENGFLVEVFRDGTTRVLKAMEPWAPARVGERRVGR